MKIRVSMISQTFNFSTISFGGQEQAGQAAHSMRSSGGYMVARLLLCSLLFPCTAVAQFSDSLTRLAAFTASGNINRTNVATAYLITNEARYSTRKKWISTNSSARWLYGLIGDRLTNNDILTTHDLNLFTPAGKLYYWGLGNYTSSFSLRIVHQGQAGLGAAYNFVNTNTAWFNVSNGILYESSSLRTTDDSRDNYQTFRNSFRLSYRFVFGGIITVNGANFWQPSLQFRDDYIIRATNSAAVKLNRWLSFTTTLTYNQFRRTGRENLLFTYGLTAEKYF